MAKRELTEDQRQELRDRLARGREAAAAKRSAGTTAPPAGGDEQHLAPTSDDDLLSQPVAALDAAADRRARLLEGIPDEVAALITAAELDDIERKEQEAAQAERKKKALDTVRAQVRQRARVEASLISADTLRSEAEKKRLMEPVKFRVRLPRDGAGSARNAGFRIDGRVLQEGQVYTETRAVFESLNEIHFRAWKSELTFRTLDQHKPGNSAAEMIGEVAPRFEVIA